MSEIPVGEDKQRILMHMQTNFANLNDDEVEQWAPWLKKQALAILPTLFQEQWRPAEWAALLSLIGPIKARSFPAESGNRHRRPNLRAV